MVDCWSVGCVVYRLLVGKELFSTIDDTYRYVYTGQPSPKLGLEALAVECSSNAINFIDRLIQVEPQKRPAADIAIEDDWFSPFTLQQMTTSPSRNMETRLFSSLACFLAQYHSRGSKVHHCGTIGRKSMDKEALSPISVYLTDDAVNSNTICKSCFSNRQTSPENAFTTTTFTFTTTTFTTIIQNMALLFRDQGEYNNALSWYRWALTKKENQQGANHSDILSTVHDVAITYFKQRQYDQALEWYNRVHEGEVLLGTNHLATISTAHNIAVVYESQRLYHKALDWYERSHKEFSSLLRDNHPYTQSTRNKLRILYERSGQSDKINIGFEGKGKENML